jgi:hypothetical protein
MLRFDFEHRSKPLPPFRVWLGRVGRSAVAAAVILGASLVLGVAGYRVTAHLSWIDAILESAMILSGMGPVAAMPTAAAKLFASAYAIFAGVVFLATAAVLVAPWAHRLLHVVHADAADDDDAPGAAGARGP